MPVIFEGFFIIDDRPHLLHDLLFSGLRHDGPALQTQNTVESMRLHMPCTHTFRIHIVELHVSPRSAWESPANGQSVWVGCFIASCKLLWQYQPLIVRASPGWHLAYPYSSVLVLPDPQSSDLPLGSWCAKHDVYMCGRHTNGEEGLTHICHQRCFEPSPLDIVRRWRDQLIHGLMWYLFASDVGGKTGPSQSLLEHGISDHTHIYG